MHNGSKTSANAGVGDHEHRRVACYIGKPPSDVLCVTSAHAVSVYSPKSFVKTLHFSSVFKKLLQFCSGHAILSVGGVTMTDIGTYLKNARNKCSLSLKDVQGQCGITDSRLSRIERGDGKAPSSLELKELARLYGISLISLYALAGYLEKSDLQEYQLVFQNADLLSDAERQNVQQHIDLLTRGRRKAESDL